MLNVLYVTNWIVFCIQQYFLAQDIFLNTTVPQWTKKPKNYIPTGLKTSSVKV